MWHCPVIRNTELGTNNKKYAVSPGLSNHGHISSKWYNVLKFGQWLFFKINHYICVGEKTGDQNFNKINKAQNV